MIGSLSHSLFRNTLPYCLVEVPCWHWQEQKVLVHGAATAESRYQWAAQAGRLLDPFGWAAQAVFRMAQQDHAFGAHLLEMNRQRMHLLAFALAHNPHGLPPCLTRQFPHASTMRVIKSVLADPPCGLVRALGRLPDSVLSPSNYRTLVDLLREPKAAKILRHRSATSEDDIHDLSALPVHLRNPVLLDSFAWLDRKSAMTLAFDIFVDRKVVANRATIQAMMGSVRSFGELQSSMRKLIDALPLPDTLPPSQVGAARRIDHGAELRALGKRWRNCVGAYSWKVDRGAASVYAWEEPDLSAVCLVERRGRLGWFLADAKGPQNARLRPNALLRIQSAFSENGIPVDTVAQVLESLWVDDYDVFPSAGDWVG